MRYNAFNMKQPKKQNVAKSALRTAFLRLFEKKDIAKISITDVANVSGYNRATFYRYYRDVYSILDEIENDVVASVQDFIFSLLQNQDPNVIHNISHESLAPFWNEFSSFIEKNNEMFNALFSKKTPESLVTKLRETIKKFFWFLIPPNLKALPEAEIMVSGLTSLQLDLFIQYLREPEKIGMERLIRFCYVFADLEFSLIEKIFEKKE